MAEQETNSAWVPQQDGTYLPSQELVEKVRANPQEFPDAAKDFAIMSGKSEEEVQAILDNPLRGGGWAERLLPDTSLPGLALHAGQGLGEAAAWAIENGGDVLGIDGAKDAADVVRDVADMNPAFDTEEGTVEKIAEVGGQVAPAVVSGFATGGTGLIPFLTGMAVADAVGTATFDPREQTLVDQIDSVVPLGPIKEALAITEDDTTASAMAKQFAAGAMVEAVAAGALGAIGKIGAALTKGNLDEAVEIARAEGLKGEPPELPGAAQATEPPPIPREVEAQKAEAEVLDDVLRKEAVADLQHTLDQDVVGKELPKLPVTPQALQAFETDTMRYVNRFAERTREITDLRKVAPEALEEFKKHSREVYTAIRGGDLDRVIELARTGARLQGELDDATSSAASVYHMAIVNAALKRTSDLSGELVEAIRRDPEMKTRAVIRTLANRQLNQTGELWDIYRNLGSKASYEMHIRRGSQFGEDELGALKEVEDEIAGELRKDGIGLYDDQSTFVAKKIIALDDVGINPVELLDDLYRQFDEFDRMSAGKKADNRAAKKLTPIEKMGAVGQFMQRLKDIQSVMLLGQFMTTGTEIISTGTHMLLLPALRKLGGRPGAEWLKEYAGYAYAWEFSRGIFAKAFKKGVGVLDDFDLKEGTHSGLEYANIKNPLFRLGWRMLKMAVDLSIASSEFFKATRAFGIAYADGLEKALLNGMPPGAAKKAAKEYAAARFSPDGALLDEDLRLRAAETAFQGTFDGSTLTGKAGRWVENVRNSEEMGGLVSVIARGALPFFRTLANIGGSGAQYIMPPGVAAGIKRFYPEGTGIAKFLDDFTGKNGEIARQTAIGRQRMGMTMVGMGFALTQVPGIEITGPSRGQRWDAKKRAFEEYPASSLIIGNTSFDLTRFLPFSAPLMLVGVLRDYQLEDQLRMEGGEYDPTEGNLEWAMRYGQGTVLTGALLLQDAGAARGVFDLFDAVAAALQDGDTSPLTRYAQNYAQQFTPGPLRMTLRSSGKVQHEGYGFWDRWAASAGFPTKWERLDFFGNPIRYPVFKGADPSNRRTLRLDDPAYREFAMLNRFEGLALSVDKPESVFDKAYWRKVGLDPDGPLGVETPSLVDLKTTSGKNAWQHYRELLYKGRAAGDVTQATSRYGDKVSVGKVLIREGENFEQAMRRLIALDGYKSMTPDARKKVWDAVFGYFKSTARDILAESVVVDPETFKTSRYGSPISQPDTLSNVEEAGKKLAADVQTTRGNPLDELFAIQE